MNPNKVQLAWRLPAITSTWAAIKNSQKWSIDPGNPLDLQCSIIDDVSGPEEEAEQSDLMLQRGRWSADFSFPTTRVALFIKAWSIWPP